MLYDPIKIGLRIKEAREENQLTVRELGYKIGVSGATISRYETGEVAKIKLPIINTLSSVLGVREEWLLGISEEKHLELDVFPIQNLPYVPDAVSAGIPETIEGYKQLPTVPVPIQFLGKYSNRKDLILMKVNGESMNKVIKSGSYIALITDIEINNLKDGDLVVFNHEYKYSLKHYYDLGDEILFQPESTDKSFRELRLRKDETLKIEGKVIMYNIGTRLEAPLQSASSLKYYKGVCKWNFMRKLKTKRKDMNLSTEYISKELDIPIELYLKYESGNYEVIPLNTIEEIGKILNLSYDYLMGYTEEISPYEETTHKTVKYPCSQQ